MYVDYDFKLGKSVRVHHGITAVLRRDVPGPYMHCKNGASIPNLKPLAIFCGCTVRFVSDLVGNSEDRFSNDAARSTLTLIGQDKCYCPGNKNEGTDKRLRMLRRITVRFIWVYRGIRFSYVCS